MEVIVWLASFFFFLSMLSFVFMKSKPRKLFPGPFPLPLVGNLHQITGPLPHRILADLAKKYGPLMQLQLGESLAVVVSSGEAMKEFVHEHDIIFSNRPRLISTSVFSYDCQDVSFSPYGNYWRQMRKICTIELLSSARVQTFRSIREEQVLNMIKSISSQEGSVVNVSKAIYSLTYGIISRAAFGKASKYHDDYKSIMEQVIKLMAGFSLVDLYPSVKILGRITGMRSKLERVHKKVDAILKNILNEHKDKREDSPKPETEEMEGEDLVDVLLNIQKSGEFGAPLTDNSLKGVLFDVFSAGGETSSTATIWAMSEMIKNPKVLERAQKEVRETFAKQGNPNESQLQELMFLQAVIKETLRMHPPAPLLLPREISEQCEINGCVIPAKTRVIVNAWAIGRHPEDWTDTERFKPERFLDSEIDFKGKTLCFIPFGAGRRICPGISFALANVELPLAQLLYHFDWKLPDNVKNEDIDMTEIFGLTVGRKHDLKLVPTAHFLKI